MSKMYKSFKQVLFYAFLIAYILLLAKALLFKEVSPFALFSAERTVIRSVSLVPFRAMLTYLTGASFNIWIALMNYVGNIVLFVPMGLYLQIFKRNKKLLNSVAIVCTASVCVEVAQYIFGLGYTDIDDVILNTLGGLLGVVMYKIIRALLKDEHKTRTAITYLFCLVTGGAGACLFVLTQVLHYKIKIF